MISMFIYDKDQKELQNLIGISRKSFAYCSDEQLFITGTTKTADGENFLEEKNLLDSACFDVTTEKGLGMTREFRKNYETAEFMLVADMSVSPMTYLTPEVRAASLLLRPFSEEQSNQTFSQFFHAVCRNRDAGTDEKRLIVQNRDGKIAIPYSSIYYIEVREKKIFFRLKEKEYSKYETLENVLEELPDNFVRCHRSFVVNTDYISRVKLSENTIYLEDDVMVPLSRSYKSQMKELMK